MLNENKGLMFSKTLLVLRHPRLSFTQSSKTMSEVDSTPRLKSTVRLFSYNCESTSDIRLEKFGVKDRCIGVCQTFREYTTIVTGRSVDTL